MATIPRERRARKGVDMATMIAMLDRFGPDAKRRARMEEQDMSLKQQGFGLQQESAGRTNDFMRAQIESMTGNQKRQDEEAQRAAELHAFAQQQAQAMAPIQQAGASTGLAGQLQAMEAAKAAQEQQAFGFQQQQAAAPLLLSGLALDNVAKAAQPQHAQEALNLQRTQVDTAKLGEMAQYAAYDKTARMDPTQMTQMGFQPPVVHPAPDAYLQQLQQTLQSNPQAALQLYESAGPQLQSILPMTPEMKISLASGIVPPELARLFQTQNPQQQQANTSFGRNLFSARF